jgi:hypothetical protein
LKRLLLLIVLGFGSLVGCLGQSKTIELDVATLESLPYTEISAPDPHLEATFNYGGVLLKDILDASDYEDIQEVKIVAKDGYTAVINVEDLDLGILIAYIANGEYIPDDTGGPVKAIFSEDAQKVYGPENWVWWVTHLEIV